ncbi:hypothetical protein DXG01_002496 [Tephrocybe rancida]|nr:hypothetical protein DXG01_002496 [Tephrocybe rancida]
MSTIRAYPLIGPYLPFEVLAHIFKLVYTDLAEDNESADLFHKLGVLVKGSADVFSDSPPFPYSLAAVSSHWGQAMSDFPEFWTRLVIFVDSFDPSYTRKTLEWSKGRHIRLTVTTGGHATRSPETEKRILEGIMGVIHPHIARCEILRFNITYTSSLPRVFTDLAEIYPFLSEISLKASTSNGIGGLVEGTIGTTTTGMLRFPLLCKLEVDGWNFVELFKHDRSWFQGFRKSSQEENRLSISHYRPHEESNRFDIVSTLPYIGYFTRLEFDDVDFDFDFALLNNKPQIGTLKLSRLSPQLARTIVSSTVTDDLHLKGGTLQVFGGQSIHYTRHLHLTNIDYPETSHDLQQLLITWDHGRSLEVDNCPGFDDDVLAVLASPQRAKKKLVYHTPLLNTLSLRNCSGYSIGALRRMAETRWTFHNRFNFPSHQSHPSQGGFSFWGFSPESVLLKVFVEGDPMLDR